MAEAINTYQEPEAESQEHVDAMLEKVEGSQKDPERPEWLPEKFKSAEDMAKAYSQLESKLGQTPQEQSTSEEYSGNETPNEVAEVLDASGLDFEAFQQEYAELGGLTEDAYSALEEAGFPPSMVDSWIEGQNALASQITGSMYDLVGGQDEYATMVSWAADNLPESEVDAFNTTMATQDPNLITLAIQGLNARYRSEAEPSLLQGGTGNVRSGGRFESNAELTAAMSDPRYAKDPAYRQQVADKLAKSSLF
ncbi:hypothetical protein [Alteromonas sp.]|uniref:capsid assembly protein n=1 Tax=Alteromonas sp. TaxID=232 RepID=UPI000C3CC166|nr:hypothetical protein [Alteromonas sp.]MAI39628.1 hypothetical protein [Alteromonas sp.]|tara:strand:- start:19012 stop:19767 length:756 start_codon:yes stop_codon:yes gene_type:complete